jgi:hypothetical protein
VRGEVQFLELVQKVSELKVSRAGFRDPDSAK